MFGKTKDVETLIIKAILARSKIAMAGELTEIMAKTMEKNIHDPMAPVKTLKAVSDYLLKLHEDCHDVVDAATKAMEGGGLKIKK